MKRTLCLLLALCLPCLALCGCRQKKKGDVNPENVVIITVADFGSITVELAPDVAPVTVENFKKLVGEHYYDGLTFHRIIENFMIQGGAGKPTSTIKGEFSSNGVKNDLKHERGVISMARANSNNSASSQFFIVQKNSPHLNGQYAAFGHVTEGMDVVDAIAAVQTDIYDAPLTPVVIESIRFLSETETEASTPTV